MTKDQLLAVIVAVCEAYDGPCGHSPSVHRKLARALGAAVKQAEKRG